VIEEEKPLTDEDLAAIDAKCREKNEREAHAGYLRSKKARWNFPHTASVIHPKIGEVIVPAASKFAAILCACELRKLEFEDLCDAEVWSTD